jgi:hypothetical protein
MIKTPPELRAASVEHSKLTQSVTRVRRRGHRLTRADAEAIAMMVAKRANEREACAELGIPYSTWNHWKAKPHNAEKYAVVLDRIRGAKIKSHLENIESFSAKDWRASECYLEKTIPDRFSNKAATVEITTSSALVMQVGGEDNLRKIVAMYADKARAQIESTPAPAQIQDAEIVTSHESKPD